MATLLGNHGAYYGRQDQGAGGVGIRQVGPVIGSYAQAIGQAGEVFPVTVAQVVTSDIKIGVFVQASAAVSIRYSLSNIAEAGSMDPAVRAGAVWSAAQTLAAGEIVPVMPIMFTVAEITFTNSASVAFYAR